jgi:hypothetical protein
MMKTKTRSAVVKAVDSFFISRQDHDYMLKYHAKFLLHLFDSYESRWNIYGLIFRDVSKEDRSKLHKTVSSGHRSEYLQSEGVMI